MDGKNRRSSIKDDGQPAIVFAGQIKNYFEKGIVKANVEPGPSSTFAEVVPASFSTKNFEMELY